MNVTIDREDGRYEAGGVLRATWRIRQVPVERIEGVEVSVMWYTEGKGDEDLHVHHFERFSGDQLRAAELGMELGPLGEQQRIECRLPPTPLSYHGRLIRIRWCIRLRLFLDDGRSVVAEQPFHLVAYDATARPRFWAGDKPIDPADLNDRHAPPDAATVNRRSFPSDDLPPAVQP